ncbi:unnamed protein product, partial [Mesorhabditis belari]|uniref:Acyltransferase 3 domain-containing protein n=1 Tax=Mesorhabditis belari TaxID=2138241 RepID=A0AAF3EKZ7_9BILA
MKSSNNYQLLGEQNEINETIVQSLSEKESCLGTTTVKKEFRDDVALLRALAILAVLGYHFWPKIFTLGFIGVDVFFVISGFLMMQMLEISSSNRPDRGTEDLPLLHSWSLGVEMQFYLIAPFLFYISKIESNISK